MPETMDSILDSIKQMLGIPLSTTSFDLELTMHINSGLMVLNQLGVGPSDPVVIANNTNVWSELGSDVNKYQSVKPYLFLKVKLLFDPPTIGAVMDSMTRQLSELEYRLAEQVVFVNYIPPTV